MFRQYREFNKEEFIVVGVDTAAGGSDYCAAQFLSVDNFDVPLVYHSKEIASDMTPKLVKKLEDIYVETGVTPVVAYERNNGGVFEVERLIRHNTQKHFVVYQTKSNNASIRGNQSIRKYGWDTSAATRPGMLADLKKVIDDKILTLYDLPTIAELFSFVEQQTTNSWRAVAEVGKHDDLVTSLAIAVQLSQTEQRSTRRTKAQVIREPLENRKSNKVYSDHNEEMSKIITDSIKDSTNKNKQDWRYR
jgi:hypothetical protein